MELSTLQRANELQARIRAFETALECFEEKYGENEEYTFNKTPQIIINIDDGDGGRENIPIPMVLNNGLIDFLKVEIESTLEETKTEFENL